MGNIFFLDTFLGGAFLSYGTDVVRFSNMNQEQRTDPMVSLIKYFYIIYFLVKMVKK